LISIQRDFFPSIEAGRFSGHAEKKFTGNDINNEGFGDSYCHLKKTGNDKYGFSNFCFVLSVFLFIEKIIPAKGALHDKYGAESC
jgi:hypothetical protein